MTEVCLRCGVCCAVKSYFCHAQYEEGFDEKRTYVYHCLGAEDPAADPKLWLCTACHKCEETCPYEVSPLSFIEEMKAQAFRRGVAPELLLSGIKQVVSTGYLFPLTASTSRRRAEMGLRPLGLEAAKELGRLAEETRLIGGLRRREA
jgi:heterodisulfide reductase subunit C